MIMNSEAKNIAKNSKSSFFYAFNLLPAEQRNAMNTVYAFCSKTDDIVDENDFPNSVKYENLRKWRIELEKGLKGESSYPLLNNLSKIISQFNIPITPFFDLIKGMEMDIEDGLAMEAELFNELMASEEALARMSAYVATGQRSRGQIIEDEKKELERRLKA